MNELISTRLFVTQPTQFDVIFNFGPLLTMGKSMLHIMKFNYFLKNSKIAWTLISLPLVLVFWKKEFAILRTVLSFIEPRDRKSEISMCIVVSRIQQKPLVVIVWCSPSNLRSHCYNQDAKTKLWVMRTLQLLYCWHKGAVVCCSG